MKNIVIRGAREHNLQNIDLELPRDSLIVISGLSGSGKSSLAFDTIFAEGQRRYVESLSAYARQFLGRMDKPDVDYLEGLSPAISIEQKTSGRNPRSTVGTITEIYDYLRLLYARIGVPHCPNDGIEIKEQSVDQILDSFLSAGMGKRIMILAPLVQGKKGEHRKLIEDARRAGFVRIRIGGVIHSLDDDIILDKKLKHTISVVVDRMKLDGESEKRLAESVETALEISDGKVNLLLVDDNEKELFFSEKNSCPLCGFSLPELQPRMFSFNSPFGACASCDGLGMTMEFDRELIMPDSSLSFNQRGLLPYNPEAAWHRSLFEALARELDFSLDTPLEDLGGELLCILFQGMDAPINFVYKNKRGTGKFEYVSNYKGIIADLKRRYVESTSSNIREWLEGFMKRRTCRECEGRRLRKESLCVLIDGRNIHEITQFPVHQSVELFGLMSLSGGEKHIASQIIKEITERLSFLDSVGLGYLTLAREAGTLSGGESQRIRLATQIGSSLVGVLYILDEPTIGLHQRDNQKLIDTLTKLRDLGNTLIVVEHDDQTIRTADYIVDMGPGAGVNGGRVVAQGNLEAILADTNSPTGRFLSGREKIDLPEKRRQGNGLYIEVRGAKKHNLKNIDVQIPLGSFVAITGVSGSGKSTLLSDILYPGLRSVLSNSRIPHEKGYDEILGIENVDKVISINQNPIGRTPRSNPATYVGLFGSVRELFSSLPESKVRGYKPGRFSFNVKGGRCESCEGAGTRKIEMHFLPDVYVVCDVCKGKRFNRETLEIRYKGKNIHEVLGMPVEKALEFFSPVPAIRKKLETLNSVGLGYIRLGQSALTLSGGEAQRVKLSLELSKRSTGRTFYIIDEPTTGLHFADVKQLLEVLQTLIDRGNTICMIEHNMDVIKQADYVIDLGPEGGEGGGHVVATGSPLKIAGVKKSYTGRFLKDILEKV